jgi:hypothetical protein
LRIVFGGFTFEKSCLWPVGYVENCLVYFLDFVFYQTIKKKKQKKTKDKGWLLGHLYLVAVAIRPPPLLHWRWLRGHLSIFFFFFYKRNKSVSIPKQISMCFSKYSYRNGVKFSKMCFVFRFLKVFCVLFFE